MYNKIILVGNLTRDVDLKYAKTGTAIANTAIATSRKFTQNGEKKEEVMYIDLTFFGRSGEVANQYLRKGSKILVEGRLDFSQWVDQNGGKRSKHVVLVETMQMLGENPNAGPGDRPQQPQRQAPQPMPDHVDAAGNNYTKQQRHKPTATYENIPAQQGELPDIDVDEDEIPF